MDGQTDGQGDYYRAPPTSPGGALKYILFLVILKSDLTYRYSRTVSSTSCYSSSLYC